MSGLPEVFEIAMTHETALQKLLTLGIEYEGGHLPQDRFCQRVIQILAEHQKELIALGKRTPAAHVPQTKE